MSPVALKENLNIRTVAVIGAGPCGLAGAKYLAAEKTFTKIEVFEQRAEPGGVWNYTPHNSLDHDFSIPRTRPTSLPDKPLTLSPPSPSATGAAADTAQFVSPVYDLLETNIPHTLMAYTDQPFPSDIPLFPPHGVVRQYLHDYARDLEPMLSLQTQVLSVRRAAAASSSSSSGARGWEVRVLNLQTQQERTTHFDAVLIASGHYNDPFIPDIPGLAEFDRAHPGCVSHSKFYRRPDEYAGKKVIIVGNSASGIDLSAQIATVCQLPIIVSEKVKPKPSAAPAEDRPGVKMVPEITEFIPSTRSVVYANGTTDDEVDAVIFCTGYFYSFPFLKLGENADDGPCNSTTASSPAGTPGSASNTSENGPPNHFRPSSQLPPIITDGSHAAHLYQHILYTHDPSLAFVGIPQRIVPFPVSEAQAAWTARIWSGRLAAPSFHDMTAWEEDLISRKCPGISNDVVDHGNGAVQSRAVLHNMAFPQDVEYINTLYAQSMAADSNRDLFGPDNEGSGKIPPYWGADKAWMRERFPLIKAACRALGEKRHAIRTLEELGFDYAKWKVERDLDCRKGIAEEAKTL